MEQVGKLNGRVVEVLGLNIEVDTPIFVGANNVLNNKRTQNFIARGTLKKI